MRTERERNLTLEWVKLVAAYLVVCIHVLLPGDLGPAVECIGRWAVPTFFAISGYYALGAGYKTVERKLKRTLRLLLWTNALYYVLDGWLWLMTGKGTLLEFYLSSLDSCRLARLLLVGAPPVGGGHLWFVSALVFCYAVLYVYVRFFEGERVEYNYLYCVSVCLLAGFYYSDSIMDLSGAEYIHETTRNGLFLGLPCFSLGLFLHEHQERIFRNFSWSNRRSLALIALGLAVSLLQQFGTGKAELPLGMMLVVPTLFLFCVQNPTLPERIPLLAQLAPWAGRLSMWIFVLHILVYRQLEALAGRVESVEWMISQRAPVPETVWVMLFTTLLSIAPCFLAQRVGEARKKRRCGKPSCGRE